MVQKENVISCLKKLLTLLIVLCGSIALGYFLLVLVYCIPTKKMEINLKESAAIFVEEGTYPQKINSYIDSRLDNWTDSLMLLTAVREDSEPAYISAALNSRNLISDKNPCESLIQIYAEKNTDNLKSVKYGRYWHGYLVFLKPLLLFFDYGEIRYINMFVQMLLFAFAAVLLSKKERGLYILPLALSWLFLNPLSTMLSIQFSIVTSIVFSQIIVMLIFEDKYYKKPFLVVMNFFVLGCIVNYFDLLTYPLVALGIPLAYWFNACELKKRSNIISVFGNIAKYCVAWVCGYGGMWIGKWLLGSIVTGENILSDAMNQVAVRTDNTVAQEEFSFTELMGRLFYASNKLVICFAIFAIVLLVIYGMFKKKIKISLNSFVVCSIIGAMPFVWYAVLGNHSWIHFWFAYRELAIFINALLMLAVGLIQNSTERLEERKKI